MKKIIFLCFIFLISIISVNAKTGSITIRRYDEDGKKISNELLRDTKVKLFKRNCLIMTLMYDSNNEIFVDNLEFAEYKIEEEIAPIGYDLDNREYIIYLSESKNHDVNLSSKRVQGTLIVNKYYNVDNNYLLDKDAIFEIYENNKLIKTLTPINGIISEKLYYGDYLIKQVNGKKYYEFADEFNVSIKKSQDYKFDLYSDMESELKEIFNQKEIEINNKYQQLINFENSLTDEKNNLINLKNELELKELSLENEKNELEKDKFELDQLREEIDKNYSNLSNKIEEIKKVEEHILKDKNELDLLKENLNTKEADLNKLELFLNEKKERLNFLKNELNILNSTLKEKEIRLNDLVDKINDRELELNKRESEIIKIENKNDENVLIVEVPNTHKKNYNKFFSKLLIIIGSILIIISKRKVTNY